MSLGLKDDAGPIKSLGPVKGKLELHASLARFSWFRTGGVAEILFEPADEADLTDFLKRLADDIPVNVIGLGSNLLVRDGGVDGVVIHLGQGFAQITIEGNNVRAGAAAPDVKLAHAALKAGLEGLSFFRGIPGTIGGALAMNGGAYGAETADVFLEAHAVDRKGRHHKISKQDMGFSYRHANVPKGWIFTQALFAGTPGNADNIAAQMNEITKAREQSQPVGARTGGSTFKNPANMKAWELIDQAGCRGLIIGDAQVSEKHCNFLINMGKASAADLEALGEQVRAKVKAHSGIMLEWEIKRIGKPAGKQG